MPAFLEHREAGRGWLPDDVLDAPQVVVLLLDGLGWLQLQDWLVHAPAMAGLDGQPITSVAPSTTATALTSFATGRTPGEHGVVGYKTWVDGELLNCLRWNTPNGDARGRIVPDEMQPLPPFLGEPASVVMSSVFVDSGFSSAHLRGASVQPFALDSALAVDTVALNRQGEKFVYAYYDGVDQCAHIYGFGDHFASELQKVDAMVAYLVANLSPGTALVVTADHGQVHVGDNLVPIAADVMGLTQQLSGEARFQWLHGRPGRADDLLGAAVESHGDQAWICSREQVIDEGWFGRTLSAPALARLGDVAMVANQPLAFHHPDRLGPQLVGRHGSMTEDEVLVPLLSAVL